jgi:hypothetical protein
MEAPTRFANSRAKSTDTPHGSPLSGFFCASTGLPKLIAARKIPLSASSFNASLDAAVIFFFSV